MSRQNNKTLQKHLAWLRATGKMSKWLEKRLEWDEETRNEILAEMFNRNQFLPASWVVRLNDLMKQYYYEAIKEQFEHSTVWKWGQP